jgi:threonine aldolase
MYFGSDNSSGASERLMDALIQANTGNQSSYGGDEYSEQARKKIAQIFNHEVAVFFVTTGTAANALALSAYTPSYGAILCHQDAHINVDECGAPEFFTGGAKLVGMTGEGGKITPDMLTHALATLPADRPHNCPAKILSLTQSTESGLVYSPEDISALTAIAKKQGLSVHMDGARFSNAVSHLSCSPADITWRAGVDVLCMGATKDGALGAEAIIFFNPDHARDFDFVLKRAGQLVSKSRWIGAQMNAWLDNDHWLDLARHSNKMANKLALEFSQVSGVRLVWQPQANAVFAVLSQDVHERLQNAGAKYYEWPLQSLPGRMTMGKGDAFCRFVTSFKTSDNDIRSLITAAQPRP